MNEGKLQIGTVLEGRYRLVSEGTSQDLGTAYKAYDTQTDRLAAVLVLASRYGSGVAAWDRLTRLQQALADLAEPDLIPFEHVGLIDGQPYLVRSPIEGQTLASLLAQTGRLKIGPAVEIAIRLCEALAPAHQNGMVHGGLSPESVMVGEEGQIAVLDAGLLPALQPLFASHGQPWGRFPYLSPEQAAGKGVQPATDVYLVGALLYQMLAGRPPFRANDRAVLVLQHTRQEPPSLQILLPQIPLSLAQIVHKALAKEPAARYRNAGQLAHILRSKFGPQSVPQPEEPRAEKRFIAEEHIVVPAPPSKARSKAARPASRIRRSQAEIPIGDQEFPGLDWLMIGLIIVALIAVLGLIPLWRTVYRRYSIPPPLPTPISYRMPEGDTCLVPAYLGHQVATEWGDLGSLWHNVTALAGSRTATGSILASTVRSAIEREYVACGVQITGCEDLL